MTTGSALRRLKARNNAAATAHCKLCILERREEIPDVPDEEADPLIEYGDSD
jgi:hypothetical protein